MMLFTAFPLTMALCNEANAVVSDAAKARKSICADIKNIKDTNDVRLKLKPFCNGTTLHCTTHSRGGIGLLGRVQGVCDHPNLCSEKIFYDTCKEQCLDERTNTFGINDDKSKKIKAALEKCSVKITPLASKETQSTAQLPQYTSPPPMDTPLLPPMDAPSSMDTPLLPPMAPPPPPMTMNVPPPPSFELPPETPNLQPKVTDSSSQGQTLQDQIRNNNKNRLKNSNDRVLNIKTEEEATDMTGIFNKAMAGRNFDHNTSDSQIHPNDEGRTQEEIDRDWE